MNRPNKAPVSVLIPTKNEEENVAECVQSVSWADEVVVFDSYSEDRTVQIAHEVGAKVVQREFDNFSAHKNWALDHIRFNNDWILIVDADERVTEALAHEIGELVESKPKVAGYYIARQILFAGKWMRHGGWYPNWNLRLFRRNRARYEARIVHEHMLLDGQAGFLKNPLLHNDYRGIERYFDRHNTYSSMEAVEVYRTLEAEKQEGFLPPLVWARGPERRRLLKNLAYRYLPARSLAKFLWMYLLQLGFLDGRIGFRHCVLHMFYEYQISLKLEELKKIDSPVRRKYREYL